MRAELLDYLVCPSCRAGLELHLFEDDAKDEIEHGLLVCKECLVPYPIAEGIPRLLPNAFRRLREFRKSFSPQLSRIDFREGSADEARKFETLHRLTARAFGYEWNTYRVTSRAEDLVTWSWLTGADPKLY